jgi:hypothetical protein
MQRARSMLRCSLFSQFFCKDNKYLFSQSEQIEKSLFFSINTIKNAGHHTRYNALGAASKKNVLGLSLLANTPLLKVCTVPHQSRELQTID